MENIEKLIDKEKIMKQLEEGKEFRKRRIELSESNYEVLVDEIKIHIRDKFTNEIKEEYDTIVRGRCALMAKLPISGPVLITW